MDVFRFLNRTADITS